MRGYIEQLVAEGLLLRDGEPYPVLRLTRRRRGAAQGRGRLRRSTARCSRRSRRRGARAPVRRTGAPADAGAVRRAARRAAPPRARARRAAVRHLPRHDAAGHGRAPSRRRSTISTRSTASAPRRRPISAMRFSTRFERSGQKDGVEPTRGRVRFSARRIWRPMVAHVRRRRSCARRAVQRSTDR